MWLWCWWFAREQRMTCPFIFGLGGPIMESISSRTRARWQFRYYLHRRSLCREGPQLRTQVFHSYLSSSLDFISSIILQSAVCGFRFPHQAVGQPLCYQPLQPPRSVWDWSQLHQRLLCLIYRLIPSSSPKPSLREESADARTLISNVLNPTSTFRRMYECIQQDILACGRVDTNSIFYSFGAQRKDAEAFRDLKKGVIYTDAMSDEWWHLLHTTARFQLAYPPRLAVFTARFSQAFASFSTGEIFLALPADYMGDLARSLYHPQ